MNCEDLRERLLTDPARQDDEFLRHAGECAPCQAFRERLLRAEHLIGDALRFNVDELGAAGADVAKRRAIGQRVGLLTGLAASVLAAVAFWQLAGPFGEVSTEQLALAVVEHWDHEPESLTTTDVALSEAQLAEVLGGTAELALVPGTRISYAKICRIAGQRVPHLVVQGARGPYMVVLLPGRVLESAVPLRAQETGIAGRILPAGAGSIAVLGAESDELGQVESLVGSAVNWTI